MSQLVWKQVFLSESIEPQIIMSDKKKQQTLICPNCKKEFHAKLCGRPSDILSRHQLKQASAILTFDIYKQGRINRVRCPVHGDLLLAYRYQKSDGIHVRCDAPGCCFKTHFDEVHFDGRETEEE